jgi:hypothetical protein
VSQIALVTDKHDHDVGVCMISQLLKPSGNIVVSLMFADVVYQQGSNGTSVVC